MRDVAGRASKIRVPPRTVHPWLSQSGENGLAADRPKMTVKRLRKQFFVKVQPKAGGMVVGRYSLRADHPADQLRVPPAGQQGLVRIKSFFIQTRNSTECGRFRLVMALPLARLFE